MKLKISFLAVPVVALAAILSSCSDTNKWHADATIEGAAGLTATLENSNNGRWIMLEKATFDDDGKVSFSREASAYPDIYRITVEGKSVYFPIDSIDNVTITASLADMDSRATLAGAPSAELMQSINDAVSKKIEQQGLDAALSNDSLKRELAGLIQDDWSGICAYYLINKKIGNRAIFDPRNRFDRSIIRAVANAYAELSPGDPRSEMLKKQALQLQADYNPVTTQVEAMEMLFPELELRDINGTTRKLSEEWAKGKLMVVNFTTYGAEESPAYNILLSEVYNKYKERGMEIYQVVCDADEYVWRLGAKNVPWISVYCGESNVAQLLRYNVQAIPTTFVIDSKGEKLERVDDLSTLDATVARLL